MRYHHKTIFLFIMVFLFGGCVQETYKRTVHFVVDMRGVTDVNTVSIRGDFRPLNWNENYPLSDADGDSIYTTTITFDTPFDGLQFKYVLNEATFELNGQDNRKVIFKNKEEVTYRGVFDQMIRE